LGVVFLLCENCKTWKDFIFIYLFLGRIIGWWWVQNSELGSLYFGEDLGGFECKLSVFVLEGFGAFGCCSDGFLPRQHQAFCGRGAQESGFGGTAS
jgi:hypothetical protein